MRRPRSTLRLWIMALGLGVGVLSQTHLLPAALAPDAHELRVHIDGVDYGSIDTVEGLPGGFGAIFGTATEPGRRVTLVRDFVTEPSLYLWAKNTMRRRTGLRDIQVKRINSAGQTIGGFELKLCQPLSWSLESATAGLGGFHESIEFAVHAVEPL